MSFEGFQHVGTSLSGVGADFYGLSGFLLVEPIFAG
jgi:hypothetical protein